MSDLVFDIGMHNSDDTAAVTVDKWYHIARITYIGRG
jgi:hypothetical protein